MSGKDVQVSTTLPKVEAVKPKEIRIGVL